MNASFPRRPAGRTLSGVGEFPPWQLVAAGVAVTVLGMIAGAKFSEIVLPLLMPGTFG